MWNITTKPFILISLFSAKQTFNFEEYNFSQSTLEQVGGETKQGVLMHHMFEFSAGFLDAYRLNYIQTNHSDIYLSPHAFRSLHQAAGLILADYYYYYFFFFMLITLFLPKGFFLFVFYGFKFYIWT